ncbi:MAG: DUF5715 family protein [Gemmatimonadota bacterium]
MNPSEHTSRLRSTIFASMIAVGLLAFTVGGASAQSLLGSSSSLDLQNQQARQHDFSYLRTPGEVTGFVQSGYLVPVTPTRDMDLHQVSFPYARPEVRVFIQRLASQYRAACGEKLVVTSLTRPISNQPANASSRSVHPTGMAVDLRRSNRASCREWLEATLLGLESEGVLDATRERRPPHYHLAVFPRPYSGYLAAVTGDDGVVEASLEALSESRTRRVSHVVQRGETLSAIADRYGSSVSRLRIENGLRSDRLSVGQQLEVPVVERVAAVAGGGAGEVVEPSAPRDEATAGFAMTESPPASSASPPMNPRAETTSHTVARGESLWLIARRYDVDESALRRANRLASNQIYAGQELRIPGSGDRVGLAEPLTHTVARGESLWTIARAYGVDENRIRVTNGLRGSRILVGQALRIPGSDHGEGVVSYTVARGESLWTIANRHGTTVEQIRRTNGMDTTRIYAGQVLAVPLTF